MKEIMTKMCSRMSKIVKHLSHTGLGSKDEDRVVAGLQRTVTAAIVVSPEARIFHPLCRVRQVQLLTNNNNLQNIRNPFLRSLPVLLPSTTAMAMVAKETMIKGNLMFF